MESRVFAAVMQVEVALVKVVIFCIFGFTFKIEDTQKRKKKWYVTKTINTTTTKMTYGTFKIHPMYKSGKY